MALNANTMTLGELLRAKLDMVEDKPLNPITANNLCPEAVSLRPLMDYEEDGHKNETYVSTTTYSACAKLMERVAAQPQPKGPARDDSAAFESWWNSTGSAIANDRQDAEFGFHAGVAYCAMRRAQAPAEAHGVTDDLCTVARHMAGLPPAITMEDGAVYNLDPGVARAIRHAFILAGSKVQPKGNDKADEWRKLAQQFDGQRMAAMVHLRTLLAFPQAHAEAARAFLAATPAEQIASVQAPAPGAVELPAGLSHSDAEFWLRKRGEIIDALRAEGLTMVTTLKGVQFMRLGKIEAQTAAQAPQ